mgnify:CR=1 FL=1
MERTNRAVTSRKTEQMPEMPVECMWMGMRCEDCRKFLRDRIRLLECRPRDEFVKICRRDRQLNRDSSVGKHRETEKKQRAWDAVFVVFLAVVSVAVLFLLCQLSSAEIGADR